MRSSVRKQTLTQVAHLALGDPTNDLFSTSHQRTHHHRVRHHTEEQHRTETHQTLATINYQHFLLVQCVAELPGASRERHEVAEVIDQREDQVAHGVWVLRAHKVHRVEWWEPTMVADHFGGGWPQCIQSREWFQVTRDSPDKQIKAFPKATADDDLTPNSVDSISAFPLAVRSL